MCCDHCRSHSVTGSLKKAKKACKDSRDSSASSVSGSKEDLHALVYAAVCTAMSPLTQQVSALQAHLDTQAHQPSLSLSPSGSGSGTTSGATSVRMSHTSSQESYGHDSGFDSHDSSCPAFSDGKDDGMGVIQTTGTQRYNILTVSTSRFHLKL